MLSSPIVIHVLRPYANEDLYLAHEGASINSKSMLLIDQLALPAETSIVFDIQLANGQKPIRAEGKVIGHVEASADKPGGLRVRFTRFGAATKAFIDRAVSARPMMSVAPARPSMAPVQPSLAPVEPSLAPAEPLEASAEPPRRLTSRP
jgi:hypothetical protein